MNNPNAQTANITNHTINYNVPVLYVRGNEGEISCLPFTLQQTHDDKPLRIAIIDDTPGGSSKEIRDNMWLAAVTAALLRNNPLHGVKISVEFQGNVDGPSAGAVCCIAILSAMEGVEMPDDFAMTGAIFPDGTIGMVGGIVEKVRAAAQQGKKRIFVPGYHRVVKDSNDQFVDLVQLAEELNINLFRVENIEEAFRILYNVPMEENKYIDAKRATFISRDIENLLTEEYVKYTTNNEKIIQSYSEEDLAYINSLFGAYFNHISLFFEGKFPAAFAKVSEASEMLSVLRNILPDKKTWTLSMWSNARKKLAEIHEKNAAIASEQINKMFERYQNECAKVYAEYSITGFVPTREHLSPITAQLVLLDRYYSLAALYHACESAYLAVKDLELSDEQFDQCLLQELMLRVAGEAADFSQKQLSCFYTKIAELLPNMQPSVDASKIEEFFKTAQVATREAAESAISYTEEFFPGIEDYEALEANVYALECHNGIEEASFPDYHIQVSLKMQVTSFVKSALQLVKLYQYCSTDFLEYLIRKARKNALSSMQMCVDFGIPCIDAVRAFQYAESSTNEGFDRFTEVLENYWYAAIYAKALYMSFK